MTRTAGNVIKNDAVKVAGTMKLGRQSPPVSATEGGATSTQPAPQAQGARIISSEADHVMIEVTCRCGHKIHLRCEHPQQE